MKCLRQNKTYMNKEQNQNMLKLVDNFVKSLKSKPEVDGIVLMGGFSKGRVADQYSDIDVCVFVDSKAKWLPKFEFNISTQNDNLLPVNFVLNVYQSITTNESSMHWGGAAKHAYKRSKLVYDKSGVIKDLIKRKTEFSFDEINKLRYFATKIQLYLDINPTTQSKRGHYLLAHQIFNSGIDMLLDVLFLLNRESIPNDKWKLLLTDTLLWVPKNFHDRLYSSMVIKEITSYSIKRRVDLIAPVLIEVCEKIERFFGESITTIYENACSNILERQLNKSTFSDSFLQIYCKKMSLADKKVVEGFINYNLIEDIEHLIKIVSSDKSNDNIAGREMCLSVLTPHHKDLLAISKEDIH